MADQDKEQKPKATLIKHRKEDVPAQGQAATTSADDAQKKKIKVVVRSKAHPTPGKPSPESPSSAADHGSHAATGSSPNPHASSSSQGTNPRPSQSAEQGAAAAAAAAAAQERRDYSSKQGIVGGRYVGPRREERPRPAPEQSRAPSDRPPYQGDRPQGDRPQGERPPYQGDRPQGDRPPYQGDRPYQPRPQGDRPPYQGDRPYTPRPQGDRPPYQGDRPYQPRPQGDRPPYQGDRPPYQGDRPYPPRPQGDRPPYQGDRPYPPRPQGDRPPYQGDRPYQSRGPGGPGGQGSYGPRPGGPGGPGGRPPYNGPRPGGSGRPPAGGGNNSAAGLPPGPPAGPKKFFKAKKKENFVRKDRHLEKEIQLKNKKSIIKLNPVPKEIDIMEVITVAELARKMNLKASDLIGKLFSMGMMVSINQQIDAETATILAEEYSCKVNIVSLYEETLIESDKEGDGDMRHRPPVVTVMGHVDHGKTKTLDAIRTTNVVAGESGGITQHIGAYQVQTKHGKITFFDTPGHEAFTMMRARGAQATDIVVLVVAANDGVMPQTVEAIRHAQEAKVPIIVAVNKVDLPDANIDRVKQQLAEYNLMAEDWGGSTAYYEISALKRLGIEELLEGILLQAEVLELTANYTCRAEGKIIESKIDQGRGIVATVIVQRGTLKVGDSFVAGVFPGKVRALYNDKGEKLDEAPPSTPVEVLGFSGVPEAGDPFQVTENDKFAREIGEKRQELKKMEEAKNVKKITLDNLFDSIQSGEMQELKVIVKGDVHGSVEAIQQSLEKLSTKEIKLNVITAAAGAINEGDVRLASASKAIIVGFHVRPSAQAQVLAEREKVEIRKYSIIYDVIDDMRTAMEGMLAPDLKEEQTATIEVREVFKVPKLGTIAGAYVQTGSVKRSQSVHVVRDGIEIFTGKIISLRRFKDDVKEVGVGYECGIGIENFTDLQIGDTLEAFEIKEVAKKLSAPLSDAKEAAKEAARNEAKAKQ